MLKISKKLSLIVIPILLFLLIGFPVNNLLASNNGSTRIDNYFRVSTFAEIVNIIAHWIFNIAIAVATVMFLIGGFQFLISGGNEEKVGRAKKTMLWAAVGLAVCLIGSGFTKIVEQLFS